MTMTNEEIQALAALADKATPGPWVEQTGCPWTVDAPGDNTSVCIGPKRKKPVAVVAVDAAYGKDHILEANAAFIAAAREALPALCTQVLELRERNEQLADAVNMHAEAAQVLHTREHEALRTLTDAIWHAPIKQMTPEIIQAAEAARELLKGPHHDCSVGRSE